jgi:hypothetical protein
MMNRIGVAGIVHRLLWAAALLMLAACAPLTLPQAAGPANPGPSTPDGDKADEAVSKTDSSPALIESEAIMRYETIELSDGTTLEYAVVLPANFDAGQEYPILLAMPPGSQTRSMVDFGLEGYWADGAIENGWIVLSPVAPNGQLYFKGSEHLVPEFLAAMAEQYRPEGGKVHIAGVSNGGISSFRIAGQHPELFHSLLALPGFPQTEDDRMNLDALASIPVAMFVGDSDASWIGPMEAAADQLTAQGGDALFEIVPGENHVIENLTGGERLFELLESCGFCWVVFKTICGFVAPK